MRRTDHVMTQTLVELEMTSTTASRAFVPVVSGSRPQSAAPTGSMSPADYWRAQYDAASNDREAAACVRHALDELAHIKRRQFAVSTVRDLDDLRERVLREGKGAPPDVVAYAMRCTPTLVRRLRISSGHDAERGNRLTLDELDPGALRAAGLSWRAVALVTGTASSTLHDQQH